MEPGVKSSRGRRAERALATRRRMLAAAGTLFMERGYAATTMDHIAADAGVAVQTVYYTFRTKGSLLCEVVEATAAGEDAPVPPMERPWAREMLSSPSGQRVLALAVEHGTGIYERVAALWPVVAAASAADPDVAAYWRSVNTARRDGQRRMVSHIAELGSLRPGLDPEQATDLIVLLLGHDVFRSLVSDAGWPLSSFRAWLFDTAVQQLLGPVELARDATSDLSYNASLADPGRAS